MNENELRELVERAHLIQSLDQHAGWQALTDFIAAKTQQRLRWLVAGNAKTVEDYRGAAGWIDGANYVIAGAIKELESQIGVIREQIQVDSDEG